MLVDEVASRHQLEAAEKYHLRFLYAPGSIDVAVGVLSLLTTIATCMILVIQRCEDTKMKKEEKGNKEGNRIESTSSISRTLSSPMRPVV